MHVIVRPPGTAFPRAISTHPQHDRIDLGRAIEQHARFTAALEAAGAPLLRLVAEPELPDAPFVSDLLVTLTRAGQPDSAPAALVVCRPAAASRRPEVDSVLEAARTVLPSSVPAVRVAEPATLEGGDVLVYGDRIAIGLSARTNRAGAETLAEVAVGLGYRSFLCPVTDRLHLATAVTVVSANVLVGTAAGFASLDTAESVAAAGSAAPPELRRIVVADSDVDGANVLALCDRLFMAAGFPAVAGALRSAGYTVVELPLDEFALADGGPTCLVNVLP